MARPSNNDKTSQRLPLFSSLALDGWKLGEIKASKSMKIATLTHEGQIQTVRLADSIELKIPFAPSCFGGAQGDRKGCIVTIPQDLADHIIELEAFVMDGLTATIPNITEIWISSIRPSEKFPPSLRCKINTGGAKKKRNMSAKIWRLVKSPACGSNCL